MCIKKYPFLEAEERVLFLSFLTETELQHL